MNWLNIVISLACTLYIIKLERQGLLSKFYISSAHHFWIPSKKRMLFILAQMSAVQTTFNRDRGEGK